MKAYEKDPINQHEHNQVYLLWYEHRYEFDPLMLTKYTMLTELLATQNAAIQQVSLHQFCHTRVHSCVQDAYVKGQSY